MHPAVAACGRVAQRLAELRGALLMGRAMLRGPTAIDVRRAISLGHDDRPQRRSDRSVDADFAGSSDYLPETATANFTIGKAKPTVSISDRGGTFTGSTFPATATVLGVTGPAGPSLEGFTPSLTYYSGSKALSGAPSAIFFATISINIIFASDAVGHGRFISWSKITVPVVASIAHAVA